MIRVIAYARAINIARVVAAGYTQKEAVEACAMEFEKWSPSDSNFSNKLDKGTFRYLQAKQIGRAHV